MQKLIFVTGNDNKAREAAAILGAEIEHVKLDLDEIQSMDLRVIVEHKARQAYAQLKNSAGGLPASGGAKGDQGGQALIVEDVSLAIKQLGGFPGPLIKWMARAMGEANIPALLSKPDRTAFYEVMYCYIDERGVKFFSHKSRGSIALKASPGGWGFDVIFVPAGETKTIGRLGVAYKEKHMPRGKALQKLKKFLNSRA